MKQGSYWFTETGTTGFFVRRSKPTTSTSPTWLLDVSAQGFSRDPNFCTSHKKKLNCRRSLSGYTCDFKSGCQTFYLRCCTCENLYHFRYIKLPIILMVLLFCAVLCNYLFSVHFIVIILAGARRVYS